MLCCEVRRTGKDDIQWFHNVLRYGVNRKSAVILYRTFDYCFAICFLYFTNFSLIRWRFNGER